MVLIEYQSKVFSGCTVCLWKCASQEGWFANPHFKGGESPFLLSNKFLFPFFPPPPLEWYWLSAYYTADVCVLKEEHAPMINGTAPATRESPSRRSTNVSLWTPRSGFVLFFVFLIYPRRWRYLLCSSQFRQKVKRSSTVTTQGNVCARAKLVSEWCFLILCVALTYVGRFHAQWWRQIC